LLKHVQEKLPTLIASAIYSGLFFSPQGNRAQQFQDSGQIIATERLKNEG